MPTPDVVWVGGEPTGEAWSSPWADAYVDARIKLAAAEAYGDFSDPDLIAAVGYDTAWRAAENASDDRFDSQSSQYQFYELDAVNAFWGAVTGVDASDDKSSAEVSGCTVAIQGGDELVPYPESWKFTIVGDHTYTMEDADAPSGDGIDLAKACGESRVWVAEWKTPIDLDDVGRDTVKMPLPRDYYVKLGVISE